MQLIRRSMIFVNERQKMLKALAAILVVIAAASFGSVQGSKSTVTLKDNRYSGIVVAINPNVAEDSSLIESIKQAWSSASHVLFNATRSRAYFGDITILIPSTWESTPYNSTSRGETYDKADVWVANSSSSYSAPFTEQYSGCGSLGTRIHLTSKYFTDDAFSANFGARGKVIVHEWAHYRWGVFDETSETNLVYNDPDGNTLISYYQEQSLSHTQCNKDNQVCCMEPPYNRKCLMGYSYCKIDPATGLYFDSCACYLSRDIKDYHASIMSQQYKEEITQFCDDLPDNSSRIRHNKNAPNEQNRLCDMKSTWTVISQSRDFANGSNQENKTISDVSPKFTVKKAVVNQRYVLVLDVSGSMGSPVTSQERRIAVANKAAKFFINSVEVGSYIGIVKFSSAASTISNLHQINTGGDQNALSAKLPTRPGGRTCIGCGIDEGIKVLERHGEAAGGYVIVMTDGAGSLEESVVKAALTKGVIVESLMVHTSANRALVELSEKSGGSWHFAKPDDLQGSIDAYTEISNDENGDLSKKNFVIASETVTLNRFKLSHTSIINIDSTIGNSTIFTYTWSQGSKPPNIRLKPPSGSCNVISAPGNSSCAVILSDTVHKTLTMKIRGTAPAGAWESVVNRSSTAAQTLSIVVNSKAARADVDPIMVEPILDMKDGVAVVYAKVSQGLNPVLLANVTATLSSQGGPDISPFNLFDAGADPDIHKNDGIYSRYVTGITGGRYSVKVHVHSSLGDFDGDPVTTFAYSRAAYNPGYVTRDGTIVPNPNGPKFQPNETKLGITAHQLGNFTRQVAGGAFDYTANGTLADVIPPSKVIDLNVKQKNFTNSTEGITLSFTAPGDDYDSGTASRYEFRYTLGNPKDLIDSFTANTLINQTDVVHGNISNPRVAGSKEAFVILPKSAAIGSSGSISIGFAVKSYDEVNNEGRISNVAILRYYIQPPSFALPITMPQTTTQTTTQIKMNNDAPTHQKKAVNDVPTQTTTTAEECEGCHDKWDDLLWLYIILPILVVLGIFVLLWIIAAKRRKARSKKSAGSVSAKPLEL